MKKINALPGMGPDLNENQVKNFLDSKLNLQLATTNSKGDPNIHPVWYLYQNGTFFVATPKKSIKAKNVKENNLVYYSLDDEKIPYRGVKGEGTAKILDDKNTNLEIAKKIILKYTGSLDNDIGKYILDQINKEDEIVLEISPKFYSTWLLDK